MKRVKIAHTLQTFGAAILLTSFSANGLAAQQQGRATVASSTADLLTRLRETLPSDVADHVLATIGRARADGLPGDALALRALKFSAKGVKPADIQRSIDEQAGRMHQADAALKQGRGRRPSGDETEAGAEAIRRGVSGQDVSALAKSAPSGRSLTVPLFVISGLIDRGLPSDEALRRVRDRLEAQAADSDIAKLARELPRGASDRADGNRGEDGNNGNEGKGRGAGGKNDVGPGRGNSGVGGGPPAGVPSSGGKKRGPSDRPGKQP